MTTWPETRELRLRMTRVMPFDPLWEQAFAATLAPTCQGCTAPFRFHAGTKTMLTFACSLGWLVSAFHKTENRFGAIKERLK
jgi:hypothetical protein